MGGLGDSGMAQQNALNQLMNMQVQNQSAFGLQNMMNPYLSAQGIGASLGAGVYQQYVPPPPPPEAPKKKRKEPDDDFRATDVEDPTDHMYAMPTWKRRLMKRYPEGEVIGGFVRRLALEIDMWHQNAAGFPA